MSSVLEDSNHVAGSAQENCKVEPDLQFYVEFRRSDGSHQVNYEDEYNYDGEYGFDWMRNDYDVISKSYDKLKSEYTKSTKEPKENKFRYTPTMVEGKEYFVPWLSFLPAVVSGEEKIIKLSLRVHYLENFAELDDIIRFSADDANITFSKPVIELCDRFNDDIYRSLESVTILKKWRKRVLETEEPDWDQLLQMAEECHDEFPRGTTPTLTFFYNLYLDERERNIKLKTEEINAETDQQKREKLLEEKQILEQKDSQKLKIEILRGFTNLIVGGREPVDYYDIKIKCSGTLSRDTLITAYNKHSKPVGYLKVLKNSNHKDFIFEITPVRVLRSRTKIIEGGKKVLVADDIYDQDKNTIDDNVVGGVDESKGNLQELENYLNKKSLNQGLLQCSVGHVVDIIIDEEKWIDKGFIIERDNNKFCTGSLLDEFKEIFESQHRNLAKKRGVVMFLVPLPDYDEKLCAGGYAELDVINAKECAVFSTNLLDKPTFSHEVAHVLGLEHSFLAKRYHNDFNARKLSMIEDADYINDIEKNKNEIKNAYETELEKLTQERAKFEEMYHDLKVKNESRAFDNRITMDEKASDRWGKVENRLKYLKKNKSKELKSAEAQLSEIEEYKDKKTYRRSYYEGWNPHKFIQAHTENIMDYYNNPISFYKFQWLAMQNDVKKYYSKK